MTKWNSSKVKNCLICKKEFVIKSPAQNLCSIECRKEARRIRLETYDYGERNISGKVKHRMNNEVITARNRTKNEKFKLKFEDLYISEDIGNYFAGFTDGEGTFTIHPPYKKDRLDGWKMRFSIQLRLDDKDILVKFRDLIKVGIIVERIDKVKGRTFNENPKCSFTVSNISQLYHIVVPFFEKFKLRAKKSGDFEIWKIAVKAKYEMDYKSGNIVLQEKYAEIKEFRKYREK